MAYDPYRGMTPGGQFVGMLGTSLSQILGGYLGAKLEQDRMQREYESNRRVLKARYPNIPEEQIAEYSQVSPKQLPELMQGLGASEFQQVMRGEVPGVSGQQQMLEGVSEEQPMIPEMQQPMGDIGDSQQDMMQQQQIIPDASLAQMGLTPEEQEKSMAASAANEMNRINAIEESLKGSNLDQNQYLLVRKYIDDSRQAVKDTILSDQQLQMKIADAERKRSLDEQKAALEREKFERKILTEDRDDRRKQFELEEKQQDRLYKQYGDQYNDLIASKKSKLEDLKILTDIQQSNSNPEVSFGSQAWNSFASFLTDKIGLPAKGFRASAGQVLEKQSADLLGRLVGDLKGSGIRSEKLIKTIAKKYPDLYQSYEARALVTEGEIAKVKLDLQMIDEAQKTLRKKTITALFQDFLIK